MIVALASPRPAASLADGLARVERMIAEASARRAAIVCFPEAYLPGLRGQDFEVPRFERADQERALEAAAGWARRHAIAVILGMERVADEDGAPQVAAFVIDADGSILGFQTKNQLDPSEDRHYVPGSGRRLFETGGLRFGIAICHEGWRYPETVRWAAAGGAHVVFHPQHTGNERALPARGVRLTEWGSAAAPYYEKAMTCRALENTIYFASVNYALRFPESATSLIDPQGRCQAFLPYGQEGVLAVEIDPARATGLLANRYAPDRHGDATADPARPKEEIP